LFSSPFVISRKFIQNSKTNNQCHSKHCGKANVQNANTVDQGHLWTNRQKLE
jgi:hypothetical protein